MPMPLVLILLVFWGYLAYHAFQRGATGLAVLYIIIGLGLTFYRLRGRGR